MKFWLCFSKENHDDDILSSKKNFCHVLQENSDENILYSKKILVINKKIYLPLKKIIVLLYYSLMTFFSLC